MINNQLSIIIKEEGPASS